MRDYYSQFVMTTGSNDTYVKIGFCPDVVRFTVLNADGKDFIWCRAMGLGLISQDGDGTTTLDADGLALVKFEENSLDLTSTPSDVEVGEYYNANGIRIDGNGADLTDGDPCLIEAWRISTPCIYTVHDGTTDSDTYWEDASIDFEKAGVCGGQKWIFFNLENKNYAYVKEVQKPAGKENKCRLTLALDSSGSATTAANSDTDDVGIVMLATDVQYPMSDVGIMT